MRPRAPIACLVALFAACASDPAPGPASAADVAADPGSSDVAADIAPADVAVEVTADTPPADVSPADVSPVDAAPSDVAPDAATAWCATYAEPEVVGNMAVEVTETSGLAASRTQADIVWAHDDSGHPAVLFGIDPTGVLRATVAVPNATNRDWEDIAVGPCGEMSCVYIGDIGDNAAARDAVTIYRLPEPTLGDGVSEDAEAMVLTYPDGARDAEALVVDRAEVVWVLAKEMGVSRVYSAPFVAGESVLELRGVLDLAWLPATDAEVVTGADYDGSTGRLLLRTYTSVAEARVGDDVGGMFDASWTRVPVGPELQGEAVAALPDGYLHVAEGRGPRLWRVRCE